MKGKKIPMRQCVGCRESKEKKELIRIVKAENKEDHTVTVAIDRTGKMSGRGAYLCDSQECLRKARKNNGLNRAFRMNVADEIYEELERQFIE